MTERYVQSTLISDHCASSTNDSLFWQWYWGQILDMSRLWPISTAWSGLTQNTLDLSILNTDLAPDCHVVGWCFFYCIPFCLVGMASFCKLCKRQFEVNSFGFFHVFFFISKMSIDRSRSLSMIRLLVVNWMSNVALQYTPYYIWQFIEERCHLCLNFNECLNYAQLLINSVYSTRAVLARWMQVTRPAYRV